MGSRCHNRIKKAPTNTKQSCSAVDTLVHLILNRCTTYRFCKRGVHCSMESCTKKATELEKSTEKRWLTAHIVEE